MNRNHEHVLVRAQQQQQQAPALPRRPAGCVARACGFSGSRAPRGRHTGCLPRRAEASPAGRVLLPRLRPQQFLLSELGTSGSLDGTQRLIVKGRFLPKAFETVLRRWGGLAGARRRRHAPAEPAPLRSACVRPEPAVPLRVLIQAPPPGTASRYGTAGTSTTTCCATAARAWTRCWTATRPPASCSCAASSAPPRAPCRVRGAARPPAASPPAASPACWGPAQMCCQRKLALPRLPTPACPAAPHRPSPACLQPSRRVSRRAQCPARASRPAESTAAAGADGWHPAAPARPTCWLPFYFAPLSCFAAQCCMPRSPCGATTPHAIACLLVCTSPEWRRQQV